MDLRGMDLISYSYLSGRTYSSQYIYSCTPSAARPSTRMRARFSPTPSVCHPTLPAVASCRVIHMVASTTNVNDTRPRCRSVADQMLMACNAASP